MQVFFGNFCKVLRHFISLDGLASRTVASAVHAGSILHTVMSMVYLLFSGGTSAGRDENGQLDVWREATR